MLLKKLTLALTLTSMLAGCMTAPIGRMSKTIEDDFPKVTKLARKAGEPDSVVKPYAGLTESEDFWVGGKRVKLSPEAKDMPPAFRERFTMISATPLGTKAVAEKITLMTGVAVSINPDAADGSPVKMNYSGTLPGFFDVICSQWGIAWKVEGESVVLYKMDTKTWAVKAIPGDTTISATVSTSASASGASSGASGSTGSTDSTGTTTASTSGSSSSSGTGSQSASVTSTIKVWTELESVIKSMLSKDGKAVISPATSTITVTDMKSVLDSVDKYISDRNKSLSQQVVINVKAYNVTLNDDQQNGIDWSLIYSNMSGAITNGTIEMVSPFAGNSASSVTSKLLNPNSRFSGTEAVIKALSKQGRVSLVTSASVTTLNSQPVPVQVAKQTGYLASVSTTTSGTAGSTTTSLTPGTITTGFNMNLLPSIYEDGRLLLQYAMSLSELAGLTSVTSSGQSIQVPEINTRNFLQRVAMKSNQTLILSGFERTTNSVNTSALIEGLPAAGGGYIGNHTRDVIVIMITPMVVEENSDI